MTAPLTPATSRAEALRAIAARLAAAGIDESVREARALIVAVLHLSPAELVLAPEAPLGAAAPFLEAATTRRADREPLHRITGRREFYGLEFTLSPGTLIPRADTETLVEAVLDMLAAQGRTDLPLSILDLGTGSGAILIALLAALPQARGLGIDLSDDARAAATANAERLLAPGRALFRVANWFDGLDGTFDVIVTNPPYIVATDIVALEPEVARHDPMLALDGGADGLDAYRALAAGADARLAPGGLIGLELGAGQREAVSGLFAREGFRVIECRRDLGGIERALILHRA